MCSVQRFATVCYVQIHVLCVLKSLRDDQRAPGGLNSRKSDLVYFNDKIYTVLGIRLWNSGIQVFVI